MVSRFIKDEREIKRLEEVEGIGEITAKLRRSPSLLA